MPRWWLITWYVTIAWALAYMIAYPAWPLISTATTGLLGYSSRAEVRAELDVAELAKADYISAVASRRPRRFWPTTPCASLRLRGARLRSRSTASSAMAPARKARPAIPI